MNHREQFVTHLVRVPKILHPRTALGPNRIASSRSVVLGNKRDAQLHFLVNRVPQANRHEHEKRLLHGCTSQAVPRQEGVTDRPSIESSAPLRDDPT